MNQYQKTSHLATPQALIEEDINTIHLLLADYQNYVETQERTYSLADHLRQNNPNHNDSNNLLRYSLQIQKEVALEQTIIICIETLIRETEKNISIMKNNNQPLIKESLTLLKLKDRLEAL